MPDVGDYEIPQLTVDPNDGTTTATLEALAPDGTSSTAPTATADGGHTWVADPVLYTLPGWWVLSWTVTGTGRGVENQRVYVTPAPAVGGPGWTPSRERVADYATHRTISRVSPGNPTGTFSADTTPTGTQVDRLIVDAVAWVLSATGPVDASLFDMAGATAAVWTAAAVERAYPARQGDVSTAADLEALAERMLKQLALANQAITGTDPEDPAAHLLPTWQFPQPVPWGDEDL